MGLICEECGGKLAAPDEVNYLICMKCGEKFDYSFIDNEMPDQNTQLLVVLEMQAVGSHYEFAMADAFVQADQENRERLWRFMPVYKKFLDIIEAKKKGKKWQFFSHPVTGKEKPMKDGEFCDLVQKGKKTKKEKKE